MVDAFDYLESRDDADELIAEFGQVITLRRYTASGTAYDPTTTPADYATKGAKVAFTVAQMRSGSVQGTDERWLVAAGPLTALGITSIQAPDSVIIGGIEREVVKVDTIAPAGT